jgi:hypothetical protein
MTDQIERVRVNSKAPFAVAGSYLTHRERLTTRTADHDPRGAGLPRAQSRRATNNEV